MTKVTVVGAGFAGLSLAHELLKRGIAVEVLEKSDRVGGLIRTDQVEHGLVESAANALLADRNVESLFADLNLSFARRGRARGRRFIFRDRPSRWPLSWSTTARLMSRAVEWGVRGPSRLWPNPGEAVATWCERIMNQEFNDHFIAPALQGIYAGDVGRLSANLILSGMASRLPKGRLKGSVAPEGGMGELVTAFARAIGDRGGEIRLNTKFEMPRELSHPLVIATNVATAAELLSESHPEVARILRRCEMLPLIRVTAFFPPQKSDLEGFGCLFPESQRFNALGVLFNSSIFPGFSQVRSESWIFGGARNPEVLNWSDEEVKEKILQDRARLGGNAEALSIHIRRWPKALPHYTTEWEELLPQLNPPAPLYLHGNYLGALGLSRILKRSKDLAKTIQERYA